MSYRTVLIENNRMMLERLSSVIRNSPGFELSARYQTAGDALGQMQAFSPNLILLDIDCELNVSLLSDLKKNCGQALIICLSRRWDSEAQARLLRGGAQGYMIKPFTPDELQAAVRNADRASLRSSTRVISFFSPKGKSGKTTLISNLAASIVKRTGEPVAILDCDLQFGDMAVFFNLNPQTTLVGDAEVVLHRCQKESAGALRAGKAGSCGVCHAGCADAAHPYDAESLQLRSDRSAFGIFRHFRDGV